MDTHSQLHAKCAHCAEAQRRRKYCRNAGFCSRRQKESCSVSFLLFDLQTNSFDNVIGFQINSFHQVLLNETPPLEVEI